MLHALLLLVAVGSLVFGVQDMIRTSSEIAQPAVTSAECPPPGAGRRLVRLNADAGPAAVMSYRMRGDGPPAGQPVVLLALNPPTGKHIVVRIAPADDGGRPLPGAVWRAGPTAGLIVPLPAAFVPMEGRERFPSGATISWLEREYEPSGSYPIAVLAGGAILLALFAFQMMGGRAPRASQRPEAPAPPDERTPFLTVEPSTVKRVVLVAIAIGAIAAVIVVRRDRAGEPKLYENPMVAVAGFAAAIAAAWGYFHKTSDGAVVCLGGLKRSDDPADPTGFVPWDEVRSLTRTGGGLSFLLGTEAGETIRLDLGSGAGAERAASAIAALVRPGILARLREQLMVGKEVDFGPLRLAADGVGWELPSGWRMTEFDDVEKIKVAGGTMSVKLVSSQFDDVTFKYQEAPNGFLLPLLFATGKSSARSSCRMSFRAETPPDPFLGAAIGMGGEDAWTVRVEPEVVEALVGHGRFHLVQAEAAGARGDPDALVAHVSRALALFEGARRSDLPEVRIALLALGHGMAETRQSSPARWAFERAFKLMEKDPAADPLQVARARHGLAVARWQCKDTEGALGDARRAAELFERHDGAPLVHVVLALNTLAGLERLEGHLLEAQQAVERLMARLERGGADELAQLGPQRLLALMQNVTLLVEQLEDTQLEVALHARGVEVCRQLAGADGLLVGQALFSLGTSQLANKEPAAACGSLEKALSIFETNLGEQHPWMAGCLDRLGEAYWYAGMRDQAEKAFELAAAMAGPKAAAA